LIFFQNFNQTASNIPIIYDSKGIKFLEKKSLPSMVAKNVDVWICLDQNNNLMWIEIPLRFYRGGTPLWLKDIS
jgi:hypothetical protein